uniref:Uncharacterized protein n=1 Tax=Caenorhabditis japonica TaxID=281687 RepID=A0A8R1IJA6_CAEJA
MQIRDARSRLSWTLAYILIPFITIDPFGFEAVFYISQIKEAPNSGSRIYGTLQTRSLRTLVDAATLATRECRKLREPWPMFCSDFSKPHSQCMRNSLFNWSELSAFYTKYTVPRGWSSSQ